jgi:hypothetical protein
MSQSTVRDRSVIGVVGKMVESSGVCIANKCCWGLQRIEIARIALSLRSALQQF